MSLSEKIALATVSVVIFKVAFAGIVVTIGGNSITLGGIDSMTIAALLTPVLGALHLGTYVNRKIETKNTTDRE